MRIWFLVRSAYHCFVGTALRTWMVYVPSVRVFDPTYTLDAEFPDALDTQLPSSQLYHTAQSVAFPFGVGFSFPRKEASFANAQSPRISRIPGIGRMTFPFASSK